MPIPDFQSMILPILQLASDQDEHRRREVVDVFASRFSLTDEERELVTEKTGKNLFDNRCDFALSFLRKHRLIKKTRYGYFVILERGLTVFKVWNQSPKEIEEVFSRPQAQIIAYLNDEWPVESEDDKGQSSGKTVDNKDENIQPSGEFVDNEDSDNQISEESIEDNYQHIRDELAEELLQKIKMNTPAFFEKLVVDLLVKMGYGGSREDAGRAVGGSGDGGIDGIINEDRLGLDVIYIQAKRWGEGNVGSPDIDKFSGALTRKGASKGVFITTSHFTNTAKDAAKESAGPKMVLIDGDQLAQLMIEHNVGVSIEKTYEIKRVDSDYFAEDAE